MRLFVGILSAMAWMLYAGQIISAVNFKLAQRWGLQESSDGTDALASHLELWTARWDLAWLWTLPMAGTLMLVDHIWWPYAAMIGGAAAIDTGGREAVKVVGLRRRGVRVGTVGRRRLATGVYVYLIAVGALTILAAVRAVL